MNNCMEIITDRDILEQYVQQFWDNLGNCNSFTRIDSNNHIHFYKLNNSGLHCDTTGIDKGKNPNEPDIYRNYIHYHDRSTNRWTDVMEVSIPLEYTGTISFDARIGEEEGNYYLLRAVQGFRRRPPNFTERIHNCLKNDIINISGREWIILCSINNFDPDSFVRVVDIITACKLNFDIPSSQDSNIKSPSLNDDHGDGEKSGDQGFQNNPETQQAIEHYAMKKCKEFYAGKGYEVEDVSATQPYDIVIRKKGQSRFVEVRGTQTRAESIVLTVNEVEMSKTKGDTMELFIVHSIEIDEGNTRIKGGTGKIRRIKPWKVHDENLTPISYNYRLPVEDQSA